MIDASAIKQTLEFLNNKYDQDSIENTEARLYSKLAMLEYCGWLEEMMDKIVQDSVYSLLKTEKYRKFLEKSKTNHSFKYNDFKKMLISTIGIVRMEEVETQLDDKIEILEGYLSHSTKRNALAHTHTTTGQTEQLTAPSTVLGYVNGVLPILDSFYKLTAIPNE